MTTRYFWSTKRTPPLLLRRTETDAGLVDEALQTQGWQPTQIIVDYMFGNNDFVEEVSAERAAELYGPAI